MTLVYLLLVGLLMSLSINLEGADKTSFVMSAPNVVEVGEQFKLTLTLTESPKSIKPPQLDNFNLIHGPSVSKRTATFFKNGRATHTKEDQYSYILSANAKGKFTFESAIAEMESGQIKSNTITITVASKSNTDKKIGKDRELTNKAVTFM